MVVKRRMKHKGPYVLLVVAALFFLAMVVFFIMSGSSPRGRIFSAVRYDGAAILCLAAFFLFMILFYVWITAIHRKYAALTALVKLSGKVFVRDSSKERQDSAPTSFVCSLIPPGLLVEKEEEADFIVDLAWSKKYLGSYRSGSVQNGPSPAALQASCTVRLLDCHAVWNELYTVGEKSFTSAAPPEKLLLPYGSNPASVGGQWPLGDIASFIRSRLP